MLPLIRTLLILSCVTSAAFSQRPEARPGFFSFVNAVTLPGKTILSIDGSVVKADGFASGERTGGIGFAAGKHVFAVENSSDCVPVKLTVALQPDASPIVIAYYVEEFDTAKQAMVRHLKLYARPNSPAVDGNQRAFRAIYMAAGGQMEITCNGRPQVLAALSEVSIGAPGEKSIVLTRKDAQFASYAPEGAGTYLVLILDHPDGKAAVIIVPDLVYSVAHGR
jgi:hypothetical protein